MAELRRSQSAFPAGRPQVAERLLAAYDAWWKETRPMMVNENVPMSPTRPFHEWYHQQLQSNGIPDWKPSE